MYTTATYPDESLTSNEMMINTCKTHNTQPSVYTLNLLHLKKIEAV